MSYRSTLFCAVVASASIAATSGAFAQSAGSIYVRADVGLAGTTGAGIHDANQPVVNPPNNVPGITGSVSDLGSAWLAGAGAGLYILSNVRADVVYAYRDAFNLDESDEGLPSNRFTADLASHSVMATAYWDFPFVQGGTGFVGFGLGWANVSMSNLSSSSWTAIAAAQGAAGVPIAPGGHSDNFAWQIATGMAFPITSRMQLEIFYRYLDAGRIRTTAGNVTANGTVIGVYGGAEGALHSHELGVSLRVPLT
jgi:opacity protein-like surface antigen